MNILKKSLGALGIILLILSVALICMVSLNDKDSRIGAAVVLSGSMEPALSVNDIILYAKQKEYKAGDIVVFDDEGMTSVHRIIKKSPREIVTKGDFNNAADPPITEDKIIGKVKFKLPKIGVVFGKEKALRNGANAKYISQGNAELNAVMDMIDLSIPSTSGRMVTSAYKTKKDTIFHFTVKSARGGNRKLNIRLEAKTIHPYVNIMYTYTDGTKKTINFVKGQNEENLETLVDIPEGEFELKGDLECRATSSARKASIYEFTIYAEILMLNDEGEVISKKSKRVGSCQLGVVG